MGIYVWRTVWCRVGQGKGYGRPLKMHENRIVQVTSRYFRAVASGACRWQEEGIWARSLWSRCRVAD